MISDDCLNVRLSDYLESRRGRLPDADPPPPADVCADDAEEARDDGAPPQDGE